MALRTSALRGMAMAASPGAGSVSPGSATSSTVALDILGAGAVGGSGSSSAAEESTEETTTMALSRRATTRSTHARTESRTDGKRAVNTTTWAHPFTSGFTHYLDTGLYSDLTVVVEGKEYKVHRIIVAHSSDFFKSLLNTSFREKDAPRIELRYEDTNKVFPLLLRYMYEGTIDITEASVIPMLAMADHFLVERLKSQCLDYVETKITRDTALGLLKQAIEFNMDNVQDKCIRVIAKNFHFMTGSDFSFVPLEVMLRLLQHPMLAVKNEYSVYQTACKYIEGRRTDNVTNSDATAIFEAVRFPFLTIKQLERAQQNTMVPRQLIIEGLMVRLKKMESPSEDLPLDSIRMTPRESYGLSFIYHHDFDQRGILHYIGTNSGQDPWENPALCGRIKMTASSIEKGDPSYLADFEEQRECWTKDIPASWFQLDLGASRKAAVTYYTLRHGGNYKADSLRNWELKGSLDGNTWHTMCRHTGDTSLSEPFASKSWSVPGENPTPYRFFRILQKGHNSSDRNFLALSGIEVYGDLYEANTSYEINRSSESMIPMPSSP